jgi:hypothetical protein
VAGTAVRAPDTASDTSQAIARARDINSGRVRSRIRIRPPASRATSTSVGFLPRCMRLRNAARSVRPGGGHWRPRAGHGFGQFSGHRPRARHQPRSGPPPVGFAPGLALSAPF